MFAIDENQYKNAVKIIKHENDLKMNMPGPWDSMDQLLAVTNREFATSPMSPKIQFEAIIIIAKYYNKHYLIERYNALVETEKDKARDKNDAEIDRTRAREFGKRKQDRAEREEERAELVDVAQTKVKILQHIGKFAELARKYATDDMIGMLDNEIGAHLLKDLTEYGDENQAIIKELEDMTPHPMSQEVVVAGAPRLRKSARMISKVKTDIATKKEKITTLDVTVAARDVTIATRDDTIVTLRDAIATFGPVVPLVQGLGQQPAPRADQLLQTLAPILQLALPHYQQVVAEVQSYVDHVVITQQQLCLPAHHTLQHWHAEATATRAGHLQQADVQKSLRSIYVNQGAAQAKRAASVLAGVPITAGKGATGIMWEVQGALKRVYRIPKKRSGWMVMSHGDRIYQLLRAIAWQMHLGSAPGHNMQMLLYVYLRQFPTFDAARYHARYQQLVARQLGPVAPQQLQAGGIVQAARMIGFV